MRLLRSPIQCIYIFCGIKRGQSGGYDRCYTCIWEILVHTCAYATYVPNNVGAHVAYSSFNSLARYERRGDWDDVFPECDKTSIIVGCLLGSVRHVPGCMYVPEKLRQPCALRPALAPTYAPGRLQTIQAENTVIQPCSEYILTPQATRCVCDAPICAILACSCVYRSLLSVFYHLLIFAAMCDKHTKSVDGNNRFRLD